MTTSRLQPSSVSALNLLGGEAVLHARRKREGALAPEESAKFLRLARVVERAETVFENSEGALNWLQSPNAALGGVSPLSLLDTDIGADSVLDTLGRIEHGVFA